MSTACEYMGFMKAIDRKGLALLAIAGICATGTPAFAGDGTPVTAITISRTGATASGPFTQNGKNVYYGQGDNVRMLTATVGGIVLNRSAISHPTIKINRIDNPQSSGERLTMFYSGSISGANVYLEGDQAADMEEAMNDEYITSGGLDVFMNTVAGGEKPNNIERVDFVVAAGINLPATTALLGEIGTIANEKHGNNTYNIGLITSLNAFGEPDGYAPLATVQGNVDYGNLGRPKDSGGTNMYNVYMRNNLNASGGSNGPVGYEGRDTNFIGMSFVSFAAMGATPGQTVYGYSLFPNDMFDSNDLVGLSDAPLNTGTGTNGGDIFGGTFAVFTTPAAELQTGTGGTPNMAATKAIEIYDPLNEGLYSIPGNDVVYTISLTNSGSASPDANTLFFTDELPDEVEFYNGDIDGAGPQTNPIEFINTGSGLSFSYASDAGYSNGTVRPTTMAGCSYTPAAGYDPNVNYICFAPSGTMNNGGTPAPSFGLKFRARLK